MKVSGENVRKAVGEVDTSLKAADEGFREAENRGEILGAERFSSTVVIRVCYYPRSLVPGFFSFTC